MKETNWIDVNADSLPPEGQYVLICVDGYVGISRIIDGEWDCGHFYRRPMFNERERTMSKLDAEYWMPLPIPPKED